MSTIKPLIWKNTYLELIDQRELPHQENYIKIHTLKEAFHAIQDMVVRGAPLIGFTALYAMVLHVRSLSNIDLDNLREDCDYLIEARPTAVNLSFEVNRIYELVSKLTRENSTVEVIIETLEEFSRQQIEKLAHDNLHMAKLAASDLKERYGDKSLNLMTLCNTGALACGPMGTALGVIEYLHSNNKVNHVYASETRPYLQGGRLTAYELSKMKVNYSITVEGAFSYLLGKGLVDAVFIGADRVVANGDTANKVGSSTLAITCKYYGIPFYVVAPTSSFDLVTMTGDSVDIELRSEDEVLFCQGQRIAPMCAKALNPSFDITDSSLIEGIICEKGLIKKPYGENINKLLKDL
jgi:methylthioribose-1-phosphate isomerase